MIIVICMAIVGYAHVEASKSVMPATQPKQELFLDNMIDRVLTAIESSPDNERLYNLLERLIERKEMLASPPAPPTDLPDVTVDVAQCLGKKMVLTCGYITEQQFQDPSLSAIVNAASPILKLYGGVSGAIFKAAGKEQLDAACDELLNERKEQEDENFVWPGDAVTFDSYNLSTIASKIIFAVGPDCRSKWQNENREELLFNVYYNALVEAHEHNLCHVAFPAISTGIFGCEIEWATPLAVRACTEFFLDNPETSVVEIRYVVFSQEDYDVYKNALVSQACGDNTNGYVVLKLQDLTL